MPTPPSLPTGNVRPLVPFFVPGGDSVNETLTHYASPNPATASTSNPVALPVREWDHAEGVFRDAIRLVHDTPAISPTTPDNLSTDSLSQAASPPRLLTPAGIRQARRRSPSRKPRPEVKPAAPDAPPPPHTSTQSRRLSPRRSNPHRSDRHTPASPPSTSATSTPSPAPLPSSHTPASPNHKPSSSTDELSESPKAQRFAGSSFEIASPPPSNLPLPAFKRTSPDPRPTHNVTSSKCTSSPPADEANQMETAALELRRILRI